MLDEILGVDLRMLPDGDWQVGATFRECNWLQGLEGDIDTSHLGFLHFGARDPDKTVKNTFDYWTVKNRQPRYEVARVYHAKVRRVPCGKYLL